MELLTVEETARMLKVSPITVRRFIAAGKLPAIRIGRGVRVRREAIDALTRPVACISATREPEIIPGRPLAPDDPILELMGAGSSAEPTDVANKKHDYLADAAAALER